MFQKVKYLLYIAILIILTSFVLLTACSKTEVSSEMNSNELFTVSVRLNQIEQSAKPITKAATTLPDTLRLRVTMNVFDQQGQFAYSNEILLNETGSEIPVQFQVKKGTYDLAFWADYVLYKNETVVSEAYNASDLRNISINNAMSSDAFSLVINDVVVDGDVAITSGTELSRAVAMLKIESDQTIPTGFASIQYSLSQNVSSINLLTGESTINSYGTFFSNPLTAGETLSVSRYIFPSEPFTCSINLLDQNGTSITSFDVENVETQKNVQTILQGDFFSESTSSGSLSLTMNQEWDADKVYTFGQENNPTDQLTIEREALIALYNATDGDNWENNTNWCSDKPLNEWYGIDTYGDGSVWFVSLPYNKLKGYLPDEFCNLSNLFTLNLSGNDLSGTIPIDFGNLNELESLWLDGNNFTDLSVIFNLNNIKTLSISLHDENIPSEIGDLVALESLWINSLSSESRREIPTSLGNCTKLKSLDLAYCGLTGSIPEELRNCTQLEQLDLSINYLSGSIPEWIGQSTTLKTVSLNNNLLSGTLPQELGASSTLEYLYLYGNSLYGDIPSSLQQNKTLWDYCWAYILQGNDFNTDSYYVEGPDFSVTDLNGNLIQSKQTYAENKYTVLWQFSPSYISNTDIDAFVSIYNAYKNKGIDFIGYCNVSTDQNFTDSESEVRSFVESYNIPWHTVTWTQDGNWLLEPKQDWLFNLYYPFFSYPATTVIDQNGEMVFYSYEVEQANELASFFSTNLGDPEINLYESTDYSHDGEITTLQNATTGNGIDIILMGDGYSDRQIAAGEYISDLLFAAESMFTEEPYKTFRELFNIYAITVVSKNEGYSPYGETALNCYFGDGTEVGGNDATCFSYAQKAISDERMDEALIIVIMNSDNYAGTCYMYYPENTNNDYGSGISIAYFPKGGDASVFTEGVHHEAGGHGFAKLADEYAYENMGAIPDSEVLRTRGQQDDWGWRKNVDFTNDLSTIRWSHFLADNRYIYDGLGAFEGGLTYWSGVWRPTENSIMRYNIGGFNAPSREAIYYRIHKLAYGVEWQYNYEEFVTYDAINRKTAASTYDIPYVYDFIPLHPPVVVNKSWRDVK